MKDTFKFIVPAELEKAADGSYKVKGLASTQSMDQQGETIIQKGIDLSPIDKKKGILNWDHQRGPENTIGLLDGYTQTGNGLYVEGRLFKNHTKAKAVKEIMESLGEGDKGRMGLSVEGKILKRNAQNPRIIEKCQINAVALTMNPVNAETFADLVKSMSTSEVEFNSEETTATEDFSDEPTFTADQVMMMIKKALGAGAAGMKAPVDRSGGEALSMESMDEDKEEKEEKPMKPKKMSKSLYKSSLVGILDRLQVLYPDCSRSEIWEAVKDRLETKFPGIQKGGPGSGRKGHKTMQQIMDYDDRVERVSEGKISRMSDKQLRAEIERLENLGGVWNQDVASYLKRYGIQKGLRLKQTSAKEREHKLYEDARQRGDYEDNKDKSRAQLAEIARESGVEGKERAKIRAQADAAKQVGDRDHTRPGVKG